MEKIRRYRGSLLGLASADDSTWILSGGTRDSAKLDVRGRRREQNEVGLEFDKETGQWGWRDADELARSEDRNEIISYLESIHPDTASNAELAKLIEKSASTTKVLLSRMVKNGVICRAERGKYSVPDPGEFTDEDSLEDAEDTNSTDEDEANRPRGMEDML
ncbi:hypothetical protein ACFL2Q_18930 [Thermodesulfobacteriota bacterium]